MNFEYFIHRVGFDEDAIKTLISVFSKVEGNKEFLALLNKMCSFPVPNFWNMKTEIKEFAETIHVNQFELTLVLLCMSADVIKERMLKNGATEKLFWDSVLDFKYKAAECKTVFGVWGNFVLEWYDLLYSGKRFEIGRLQYELAEFPCERYLAENSVILKGQPIINIHIPSSGKLTAESVESSLIQAADFFNLKYNGKTFFMCESWLLYPPYLKVFECSKNIQSFTSLFDIIKVQESDGFYDCWRVFGKMNCSDYSAIPSDTSLQRSFIDYMKSGGSFGSGIGIITR